MKIADIGDLAPTLSGHEAAELLGVHYETLLAAVHAGTCPVQPLRLGRRLRWPTAPVLKAVGLYPHPENDEGPGTTPGLATYSIAIPDDHDQRT